MELSVQPWVSQLSRKELVKLCNEKMVCAARDLAEFTAHGLNANYIVSLAHKCEQFEKQLGQPHVTGSDDLLKSETELRNALVEVITAGRQIWRNHPAKLKDYQLPVRLIKGLSDASSSATTSTHVA
jgi:hypothetical protein